MSKQNKLTLLPLTALVVGSMIGSGIFDLPKNIATSSGALGILIGWLVTGVGMLALALCFQILSRKRPKIEGSVYGYAKVGFGDYIGFNSAFGYWISAIIGNVGYFIIMFSALGYFFPIFGQGNNTTSLIAETILLWLMFLFVLRGITTAAILNLIITIAKIVPLILFIILVIYFFNWDTFKNNFLPSSLGNLSEQVKSTMLVTVFVFIGIEGASLYSTRAKNPNDVGLATILGFVFTITLLILISILSLGMIPREELIGLHSPATAGILCKYIGYTGLVIINCGLIIAVLGALLSWILLACEMPFLASKDGTFPIKFSKVNKGSTPVFALFFTTLLTQIFLLIGFFAEEAYLLMIKLCASMVLIPYALTGLFFIKETLLDRKKPTREFTTKHLILAIVAFIYGIWLIYAGGLVYLLLSMILYALGIFIYGWAKKETNSPIFNNKNERLLSIFIVVLGIIGVIYVSTHFSEVIG